MSTRFTMFDHEVEIRRLLSLILNRPLSYIDNIFMKDPDFRISDVDEYGDMIYENIADATIMNASTIIKLVDLDSDNITDDMNAIYEILKYRKFPESYYTDDDMRIPIVSNKIEIKGSYCLTHNTLNIMNAGEIDIYNFMVAKLYCGKQNEKIRVTIPAGKNCIISRHTAGFLLNKRGYGNPRKWKPVKTIINYDPMPPVWG